MQRSLCPRAGQSHNPAPGLASGGCLLNTAHGSAWGRVTFTPQPWLLCASCGCSRNVAARAGNREQGGVRQHNENGHQGKSGGSEQRRTAGQSDRGVKHHSVPPSQSTAPLTPKVRRAVTTNPIAGQDSSCTLLCSPSRLATSRNACSPVVLPQQPSPTQSNASSSQLARAPKLRCFPRPQPQCSAQPPSHVGIAAQHVQPGGPGSTSMLQGGGTALR